MNLFLPWWRIWSSPNFTVNQKKTKKIQGMKRCEAHGPGILGEHEIDIRIWIGVQANGKWEVACCLAALFSPNAQGDNSVQKRVLSPTIHQATRQALPPFIPETDWQQSKRGFGGSWILWLRRINICPSHWVHSPICEVALVNLIGAALFWNFMVALWCQCIGSLGALNPCSRF